MKGFGLAGLAAACLLFGAAPSAPLAPAAHAPSKTAPKAALVTNGQWTVYHGDNAHTGFDGTQSTASGATTGWVSGTFDAQVYAEPLVYQGVVYVATLNNTVYALNQADGTTLWLKNLGAPETAGWICGNVSPQGILGTPVIDPAANRIYVAAFMSTDVWTIFGLDLAASGNIVLQTTIPANTAGGAFDWKIQQERGALAVANGYVYVPFGGRYGDCNDGSILYQGWVFGIPTNGSTTLARWNNGGSGGAGIWSTGGAVVDDTTGKVFVTTGNGNCPSTYDNYNDAVVRLSPSLALEDYFAPQDWHDHWSCNDEDLGSASIVLINPNLAFSSGKWGGGFLVNPKALGGINGQLYPGQAPYNQVDVCLGNLHDATFGSFAYAAPYVYLECDRNTVAGTAGGLVGLKVDTTATSFSACSATCAAPSWHTSVIDTLGPPIVAGGIVWAVNAGGGNGLYGFDATTGATVYHSAPFGAHRFVTPTEAGGQIFVPSDNVVREFNLVKACTNAMLAAAPASPQTAGTPIMLTGSVSNCPSPLYKFWVQPPGASWGVVQDYSATTTYNWTSNTTAGQYRLEVDVKNTGSTAAYDSVFNLTYTINGAASCATAGLSANPASPQTPSTQVTWTGSSTGCPNPRYRFWELDPGSRWSMVQDYSAATTYLWKSPAIAGSYKFEVDVRDASETVAYDVVFNTTYTLQSGAACTNAGLTATPTSPGGTGVSVTLTGSSSTCPNPVYRFWVRDPGSRWSMVRDYSPATSHVWAQTGLAGIYSLEVDVRDASETTAYDVVFNTTYTVNGCSAASLSANPPNTAAHGTAVTLTGTATCPGTPTYRFWVRAPGGSWQIVRDYSTINTFTWTPATAGLYSLEVDVRDQNGTDTYEAVNNIPYSVT